MTLPSLLITRPKASADRFVTRLSDDVRKKFPIVISPLMKIVPTEGLPDLADYKGMIFTSANAVEFAPNGNGRPAYCVGKMTAKHAQEKEWNILATAENAEALVEQLSNSNLTGPLMHLAGRYRRGKIAERLTAQGTQVYVYTLYDQHLLPLSDEAQSLLNGEAQVVVPLFSPRTAAHFIDQAHCLENVRVIAMSEAVASVCKGVPEKHMTILAVADGQEMMLDVEKVLRGISLA